MRRHSDALKDVLLGSFTRTLKCDVFHGTNRVLEDLTLSSWTFEGDLSGDVKHSGSATVVHNSVAGESLVPEGTKGFLSPFRARLLLQMIVSAGEFSEAVVLGWVRVTRINSAYDQYADVNGVSVVTGSVVTLDFESLEIDIQRRGFHDEQQPPAGATCWGEVRRITGMPVSESLPDKTVPGSLTYEAAQGGRLTGVQQNISHLGGIPVINSDGAVTAVPTVAGPVVGELALGARGTVIDVPYSIDTDSVYTTVVGVYEREDRTPIRAVASLDLADGLFPEYTRYRSSPLVTTQEEANRDVAAILQNSTASQQYEVDVQCIINPLIELGDVLRVAGWVRPISGRVLKYRLSDSPLMNVTIEASRELS